MVDLISITDRELVAVVAGFVLLYVGGHLSLRRSVGTATRWLGLVFLSGALNMLSLAVQTAVYEPTVSSLAYTVSGCTLSAVTLSSMLFAYHFLGDDRPRERRLVTWIYVVVLVPNVAQFLVGAVVGTVEYSPGGGLYYFNIVGTPAAAFQNLPVKYVTLSLLATYGWSTVVVLRKCVRFERATDGGTLRRAFFAPRSRQARAARDFGVLTLGLVAVQLMMFAGSDGRGRVLILLLSCACVWVHVNHSDEPTRLRFKLIAIPLAVVLGLQAVLFAGVADTAREQEHAAMRQSARHVRALLERGGKEGAALTADDVGPDVRFVVARPEADGAYSQAFVALYAAEGFDARVLAESDRREEEWLVDWTIVGEFDERPDLPLRERQRRLRERLAGDVDARWSGGPAWAFYGNLFPRADHYVAIGWTHDGKVHHVGWREAERRRREGAVGGRLLLVVLATGLAIVLGLPFLYRASLLRPLGALLDGVRRVEGGDLAEPVPVRTSDEIGVLARSFNAMVASVRDARETLERVNQAAFRFVPRAFLRQLGHRSILSVELGDQTCRTMTVLFADVREFTTMSERMTPQETFSFVNSLLRELGPVIRRHHGFIDKYLGDAIMALFDGSPDDALAAAIELREALAAFNRDRVRAGGHPVRIGIGLHTGELMLGIIGEQERIDGTVLSDAVNTASRLEGLTKTQGVGILASGETVAALTAPERFEVRALERVQIAGRERTVHLHEVVGRSSGARARE